MNYYLSRKNNIELVVFNRYIIDKNGVIVNKKTGRVVSTQKNKGGYKVVSVYDDTGKTRGIQVGRALASLRGPPPTSAHTADHIDRNKDNDTLDNIRWATKKEQNNNQSRPETYKSAFVIVKDGVEKTANEWDEHLKGDKNKFDRYYTTKMIKKYAQRKQHGFSFKEYPDLSGEVWKEIIGSSNKSGRWEISNMCRVKNITKYAENVLSGERLGLISGYPKISINGRQWLCHILVFKTFFPEEYALKKQSEIIKHIGDDKLDFRPHKLQIGTKSENSIEARDNGKHDNTKTMRMRCTSYVNGVHEKDHESQEDAMIYLKSIGYNKALRRSIGNAISEKLKNGESRIAYGRTWKMSDWPRCSFVDTN